MKHIKVKELLKSKEHGQEVAAKGWVRTFRNNQFIALNDGSTIHNIQCVIDFENTPDNTLKKITTGASISVIGILEMSKGSGQDFEIQVKSFEILGESDGEYPIQLKNKPSLEFLREKAHLRVRTNAFGAIMRVRSVLAFAVHQYFQEKGFVYVNTPIITGADAEGAGEMFQVTTLSLSNVPKVNLKKDKRKVDYTKFDHIANLYYSKILSYLFKNKDQELTEIVDLISKIISKKGVSTDEITFEELILSKPEKLQEWVDILNEHPEVKTKLLNKFKPFNKFFNKLSGHGFDGFNKKSLVIEIKKICSENGWKLENKFGQTVKRKHNHNEFPFISASFYNLFSIIVDSVDYKHDFFGKQTNLTVSGQLEAETFAMGLGQVYTFGPTFRAENSNTSRHLAEFWMIEPEVAFNDLDDNMDLAEDFIKYVIRHALKHCQDDLHFLDQRAFDEDKQKPLQERSELNLLQRLRFVTENNFVRVSYDEAISILKNSSPNKKKKFNYLIDEWGADLQSEHERYLVEKHFKSPVILFNYPAKIKAFYMRLNEHTEKGKETVRAMDILFPGIGEIVGGSQREERLDILIDKMNKIGIDSKELDWYLDTRRFGSAVHSGFGLGFERLVLFVTGMTNIRDVIPFPRTPGNAEF